MSSYITCHLNLCFYCCRLGQSRGPPGQGDRSLSRGSLRLFDQTGLRIPATCLHPTLHVLRIRLPSGVHTNSLPLCSFVGRLPSPRQCEAIYLNCVRILDLDSSFTTLSVQLVLRGIAKTHSQPPAQNCMPITPGILRELHHCTP